MGLQPVVRGESGGCMGRFSAFISEIKGKFKWCGVMHFVCVYSMDIDRGLREQFYLEQCMQLRREVREADMRVAHGQGKE